MMACARLMASAALCASASSRGAGRWVGGGAREARQDGEVACCRARGEREVDVRGGRWMGWFDGRIDPRERNGTWLGRAAWRWGQAAVCLVHGGALTLAVVPIFWIQFLAHPADVPGSLGAFDVRRDPPPLAMALLVSPRSAFPWTLFANSMSLCRWAFCTSDAGNAGNAIH